MMDDADEGSGQGCSGGEMSVTLRREMEGWLMNQSRGIGRAKLVGRRGVVVAWRDSAGGKALKLPGFVISQL